MPAATPALAALRRVFGLDLLYVAPERLLTPRCLDPLDRAKSAPCGNCDTCLEPPATWDATEAAQKALSAIYRAGQRFGAVHLIDVLRGMPGERVARWGHDALSVFGVGADLDKVAWRGVFRQLVALGYARVEHEHHGALALTDASRRVLKGERCGYRCVASSRARGAPRGPGLMPRESCPRWTANCSSG